MYRNAFNPYGPARSCTDSLLVFKQKTAYEMLERSRGLGDVYKRQMYELKWVYGVYWTACTHVLASTHSQSDVLI